MIIKPIPMHLLTHTVTYEEFQEGDGITTDDGFKEPVSLSHVRVQSLSTVQPNIKRNNNAEELAYNAMLFYDVVHSKSNAPFEFTEKSRIHFDGKVMTIEKVNPVEAIKLHHYEIGLV